MNISQVLLQFEAATRDIMNTSDSEIASWRGSKVCGRVIGYQFGSTDAFAVEGGITTQFTID